MDSRGDDSASEPTDSGPFLRQLGPEDFRLYRAIRLEALTLEPGGFASPLEREVAFSANEWAARLSNPHGAIFGLFAQGEIVGLTAIFRRADEPDSGVLVQDYLRSEFRGLGLSGLFYSTRLSWARQQGLRRLTIGHRSGNAASRAAMLRAGFQPTHRESTEWPDGVVADVCYYALEL